MSSPLVVFARGVKEGVYPGGQIAASRECQRIVTAHAGQLGPGLESTSNDVVYDLASLTKPLATTVLVGRALERGKLELEDPIARFVPGAPAGVTIAQLLEHASGLPAHLRFDLALPADAEPGSWDAWRAIVRAVAETPLERAPGDAAEYSDLGFILLGAALEVALAQPLSSAFTLLGTPLFYNDRRGPPAMPPFHPRVTYAPTEDGKRGVVHDENAAAMGGAAGHAGLFGTADGVLRVAEQLLRAWHGERGLLLAPDTVRRLWTKSRVPGSTRTLGWDTPSAVGSSTGGRWPLTSVGHLGFTGTSLWIEPERALAVALVTNRVCPSRANNLIRRHRPAFYDAAWEAWGRPIRPTSGARATSSPRPG